MINRVFRKCHTSTSVMDGSNPSRLGFTAWITDDTSWSHSIRTSCPTGQSTETKARYRGRSNVGRQSSTLMTCTVRLTELDNGRRTAESRAVTLRWCTDWRSRSSPLYNQSTRPTVTRVDQSKTVKLRVFTFHHTVAGPYPSNFCVVSFIQKF